MSEEAQQLQERIAALEYNVEWLTEAYKDVAYEYLNGLVKRIEDIRAEVNRTLNEVNEHFVAEFAQKAAEATVKLNEVVENAKQNLSHGALAASLEEHKQKILTAIVDPSTGRLRHR